MPLILISTPLSARLAFQPKQKSRNRLDVDNDMRLVFSNKLPRIPGIVA